MKIEISISRTIPPFPIGAVTQTFGFVGRKGSGKTYAAGRFVEQLNKAGAPVIVLDPVGNWYGLRLDADGEGPGLDFVVLGGLHGDLPLEHTQGKVVAERLIELRRSAVLDVSSFRKGRRKAFVADFVEELFHRSKEHRRPIMVVFEEAQVFAPQRSSGQGDERMLGAVEDVVRLGRNYGIGSCLITQRPQSVHKDVLNQVECLLVGQLNARHERKAIEEWIIHRGARIGYVDELPSLKVGQMVIWSPQWLGILQKVVIGKKSTYDASATPVLGEELHVKTLPPVSLDGFEDLTEAVVHDEKVGGKRAHRIMVRGCAVCPFRDREWSQCEHPKLVRDGEGPDVGKGDAPLPSCPLRQEPAMILLRSKS